MPELEIEEDPEKEMPKVYPRHPPRDKTKMPRTTPPDPPKIRKKKNVKPTSAPNRTDEVQ